MARMPLPAMTSLSGPEWAGHLARFLRQPGLRSVAVNDGLDEPEDGFGHGGMTRVPFLMLMVEGRARAVLRDGGRERELAVTPGTAILHAPESYARLLHASPSRYLRVTCDTDHLLCGVATCLDPQRLDDPQGFPPTAACTLRRQPPEPAAGLLRLLLASAPGAQAQRLAWLSAWCWQLHEVLAATPAVSGGAATTWLAMRSWLDERAHAAIGRDDCARAFGVHPNHVARLFRSHGGVSFTQALLHARLERARILLRDPALPITEIATRCGFSDPAYFIRRFREQHGHPPGRWRELRQGGFQP